MLRLSLFLIECKKKKKKKKRKRKKEDMIWYGDLVLDFVLFQGKRFYAAPMQKNCNGVGGEYEFSMA